MENKLCLLVCRNYQKELKTIIAQNVFSDVEVKEYPQICLQPNNKNLIDKYSPKYSNEVLISDTCLLANLGKQDAHDELKPNFSVAGNCLQMLINKDFLNHYFQDGVFFVSPGWVRFWRSNLQEWGFDQQTARDFFSEFTSKITLLDSLLDQNDHKDLMDFSEYLGIPHSITPVGLDHFRLVVMEKINGYLKHQEFKQLSGLIKQANEQMADYALAFDMVSNLTRTMNELEAMREIDHTFKLLFSPQKTAYISLDNGEMRDNKLTNTSPGEAQDLLNWVTSSSEDYMINENKDGFNIRISHQSETLGAAQISQIAFPEYCQKYLNMALVITPLFGLAISKARTYQKLEEDEILLQHLAATDSLTGLYNRRHFLQVLEREFSRSKRYNSPLSIIMLDIDKFKLVNDTYGHAVGDEVLIQFSKTFTNALRKSDIPARIGGDEFVILLPETNLMNANLLAERLREIIQNEVIESEIGQIRILTSLGVAECDIDCNSADELLQHSDQALYDAKRNGANQVAFWQST